MPSRSFDRLPSELRLHVWGFTLHDIPEVCIVWPLNPDPVGSASENDGFGPVIESPLLVDTHFPVAMHVCRESRAFVQSPASGVRFRASEAAEIPVPFRAFQPKMDTLYIGYSNYHSVATAISFGFLEPEFLLQVEHLAVDVMCPWESADLLPLASPNLQSVSLVVADTTLRPKHFQPPARRCKLEGLAENEVEANIELLQNLIRMAKYEIHLYRVRQAQSNGKRPGENPESARADKETQEVSEQNEPSQLYAEKGEVSTQVAVFSEYCRGTWSRPCSGRIFYGEAHPPQITRPWQFDPEVDRVNDFDANEEGIGFVEVASIPEMGDGTAS
jgi:hypothetical protein